MTPEEKKMIGDLFERIRANQEPEAQKDREATAFIGEAARKDPGAVYTLVQMALVQEHALKLADERIRELEAKARPAAETPAPKRSFMDGLLPNSPWARKTSVPSAGAGTPMVKPGLFGGGAPQPATAPAGGSFLRSAFSTAAGIAGGMLLFEAVRGLMAGSGGAFAASAQAAAPVEPALPPAPEMAPRESADDYATRNGPDDDQSFDHNDGTDFASDDGGDYGGSMDA